MGFGRGLKRKRSPAAGEFRFEIDPEPWEECAGVDYFPEETEENHYREPLRCIAIRIRKKQGARFDTGSAVKSCAVRTNRWDWNPRRRLPW